jgi:hypothetical protein
MFRGYSGQFCVSVDETAGAFRWTITNAATEDVFSDGVAPVMETALQDAYAALADAFRNSASAEASAGR